MRPAVQVAVPALLTVRVSARALLPPPRARVALLAQTFGAGTTETLTAIPFEEFSAIVDEV